MKKKVLTSLVLAGVMAATMIPTAVFAANNTTAVGYVPGAASNGTNLVYSVPKAVTFKAVDDPVSNFDVSVKIMTGDGKLIAPNKDNPMLKTVTVKVKSNTGYKLTNSSASGADGTYQYALSKYGDGDVDTDLATEGILNGTTGPANTEKQIGIFKDGTDAEWTDAKVSIGGTLTMDTAPTGNHEGKLFSDILTYSFTENAVN